MQQIGPYVVIDELDPGRGGMSNVYRARHAQLGRVAAVKVLKPELESDRAAVQRFCTEANVAANFHHDHIVKVWDVALDCAPRFMALEFMGGGSLSRRLANGPLEPAAAVSVLTQMARALDYAHSLGRIHRDIKPDNILFAVNDRCVLTDFGIVWTQETAGLTQVGMKFGTPRYMSPEQAKALPLDHRTDLYSLGVVFFEMLVGQPPYTMQDPTVLLYHIAHEPPPRLREVAPHLSAFDALLDQALHKQVDRRFPSGAVLAQAGQQALSRLSTRRTISLPRRRAVTPPAGPGPDQDPNLTRPVMESPTPPPHPTTPPPEPVKPPPVTPPGPVTPPVVPGQPRRRERSLPRLPLRRLAIIGLMAIMLVAAGIALQSAAPPGPERGDAIPAPAVLDAPVASPAPAPAAPETPAAVSKPTPVQVPDLIGKSSSEARRLVEAKGLKIVAVNNSGAKVKNQVPPAGSAVTRGSGVTLILTAPAPAPARPVWTPTERTNKETSRPKPHKTPGKVPPGPPLPPKDPPIGPPPATSGGGPDPAN